MNMRFIPLLVLIMAVTLGACTKKTGMSEPEVAATAFAVSRLSNTVSVDEYAKCAAAYARGALVARQAGNRTAATNATTVGSIYYIKATQLSSDDIAMQKMEAATQQYLQLLQQQGEITFMKAVDADIKHCKELAPPSEK